MTRAAFDTGLEEGIARVRGAPRPLFLQPDVSAGTAWDPFRPADPVPCERPKTKKGRPGKAPPLPVPSVSGGAPKSGGRGADHCSALSKDRT